MSNRQFYNTPITPITPSESFSIFYDISHLSSAQQKDFNDLFSLVPPITDLLEQHMWFGKKPVGFFGSGNYQLFLENGSFTMQPGTTYRVRVVGGGGGGAVVSAGFGITPVSAGAGGGYSERIIVCGDTEEVVAITVGIGGQGGRMRDGVQDSKYYGIGSNGGTSSFGSYCSATGGSGGNTASSIGGVGQGGDINFQGGGSVIGANGKYEMGGASAASDFGNGISKTSGRGGNGLQSSATGDGGGGLFGNASSTGGGGLWGRSTSANGGGMFVDDGGACYTDSKNNVYTLEWKQPQTYKSSSSADAQSNSFLTKHKCQGTAMSNNMFLISRMFGKGGTTAGVIPGLGGGGASFNTDIYLANLSGTYGWGGAMGLGVRLTLWNTNEAAWNPRRYPFNQSSFGAGSPQGGGAGVITGGEYASGLIQTPYLKDSNSPQGGVGGGGGGVVAGDASTPKLVQGMSGGCGAVLVEW